MCHPTSLWEDPGFIMVESAFIELNTSPIVLMVQKNLLVIVKVVLFLFQIMQIVLKELDNF